EALSNAELIAILLRTGSRGASAIEVARAVLSRFSTLDALTRADWRELNRIRGVGRAKAVTIAAALALARRMAQEIIPADKPLNSPQAAASLLREEMRRYEVEHFEVLLLNTRHRLIGRETLAKGTLDGVLVHPRDVFRPAVLARAAAIIVAHNHPSGDPTPSEQDIRITRDLIRAGKLLQIEVLDHLILGKPSQPGGPDYVSLRELGHFYD
ncbi:MAG: DNA repair protein RadC, partial [Verrucomicrobia bacterium]|nr:DNA repair protein RadC [Verrucomicrobiota bacterium]